MIELNEPYAPRPIRSLGQWIEAAMLLKVHGIAYQLAEPRGEVIDVARDLVRRELPQLITGQNHSASASSACTMGVARSSCSSISGLTRTNCIITSTSPRRINRHSWNTRRRVA